MSRSVLSRGLLAALVVAAASFAQGVSEKEVVVGQSAALGGPTSFLGSHMKAGLDAYFKQINDAGGVHGRTIRLISYDDRYEPVPCVENTKRLIEQDKVFALVGYVGTPTSNAAKPIVESAGVPFIGPFTGAATLRTQTKWIFNLRASYEQETAAMADGLVKELGIKDVGILYQNDAYGGTIRAGATKGLAAHGVKPSCEGTYERNTLAVEEAVKKFVAAKPKAVVLGGAYAPCAEFVKQCKKAGYDPIFMSVSFVGPEKFVESMGAAAEGEVVTQVVPFGLPSASANAEFAAAMEKAGGKDSMSHVSFEGYLVGKLFCEALKAAGPNPDRASFSAAMSAFSNLDIGIGAPINFVDGDRQASSAVFKTIVKDGKLAHFDDWSAVK
jgi:branched-chain amino acid transport system substrate-binding protein